MNKIRIKNCHILTMEEDRKQIQEGEITIEKDKITYIGNVRDNIDERDYTRVIDAKGHACLPGFINTHTHAAMTLFRGFADDLPLMTWLENKIWPLEDNLTGEDVYWGTLLSILEMIKSGTSTFNDMYFFMDDMAEAVRESGIRAVLSRGLIGLEGKGEKGLKETDEFISKWHNSCEGRLKAMLGPHAPYTCPPDFLKEVIKKVDHYKLPVHIHLAETSFEIEHCREAYNRTPMEIMEDLGFFKHPVIAAHCVHLSQNDIEIMANRGVKVSHNPGSNLKLASGIAPVPDLIEAGIEVSLGTDGAASNNNLDLLEEARLAALIHKAQKDDPTVIPAYKALEMATRHGAEGLFLGGETGVLKEGYKGDVILINLDKPHFYPQHDLVAHIVYSAQSSDVETVIINGEIVMENREVKSLDEEKVMFNAEKKAFDLIKRKEA